MCGFCCSAASQQLSVHFTQVSKWLVALCHCAILGVFYQTVGYDTHSSRAASWDEVCVVTEVLTFLIVAQVSKYLHIKIGSLHGHGFLYRESHAHSFVLLWLVHVQQISTLNRLGAA